MRRSALRSALRAVVLVSMWLPPPSLAATPAVPASAVPEGVWRVTPAGPRVGDRLTASLEITHSPHASVEWSRETPRWEGLELAGSELPAPDVLPDGRIRSRLTFFLYADLPCGCRLPALDVVVSGQTDGRTGDAPADGQPAATRTVSVAALPVTVTGAFDAASPPSAPAPARGPVALPFPWVQLLAAVAALAAAVAVGVWVWRRRRPALPQTSPAAAPDTALLAARAALAELARLERGHRDGVLSPQGVVTGLSDLVRVWLWTHFHIPAPTQTSAETAAALAAHPHRRSREAIAWLEAWDLVRFARHAPSPEEAGRELAAVRIWLLATMSPQLAAAATGPGDAAAAAGEGK
ncbi:MAG: hypothetical protein OEW11_09735 [Nitrospirota bacterium]|nr:hypothetical protein [Nitrospirota bacterium]